MSELYNDIQGAIAMANAALNSIGDMAPPALSFDELSEYRGVLTAALPRLRRAAADAGIRRRGYRAQSALMICASMDVARVKHAVWIAGRIRSKAAVRAEGGSR
jgi:hypothetical protein